VTRGLRHLVGEETPALRILPADLVVFVTTSATAMAFTVARQLDFLDDLARMHANRKHEQAEFADDIRTTIEGI